jgi:putative flippase GtrA
MLAGTAWSLIRSETTRVKHGLRRPGNWLQLVRFSLVGAWGYIINLVVFSALVEGAGLHYLPSATLAFCVAVTNNFLLNRHWTFRARQGRVALQASRFFTVSLIALAFNLLLLHLFVSVIGAPEVAAQAGAVLAATPVNFIGNKLWSFSNLLHGSEHAGAVAPAPTGRLS